MLEFSAPAAPKAWQLWALILLTSEAWANAAAVADPQILFLAPSSVFF